MEGGKSPRVIRSLSRGLIRKYAANIGYAEHTGKRQRFYLRFLDVKMAAWSGVLKFAAYFRYAIPELRDRTEICRPDPSFALTRPAILLQKFGLCSAGLHFPHTSGNRINMARYVPSQSDTSETIASSVIESSHTSGAFRAASIRSAALSKRPGFPSPINALPSRIASRLSVLGLSSGLSNREESGSSSF